MRACLVCEHVCLHRPEMFQEGEINVGPQCPPHSFIHSFIKRATLPVSGGDRPSSPSDHPTATEIRVTKEMGETMQEVDLPGERGLRRASQRNRDQLRKRSEPRGVGRAFQVGGTAWTKAQGLEGSWKAEGDALIAYRVAVPRERAKGSLGWDEPAGRGRQDQTGIWQGDS